MNATVLANHANLCKRAQTASKNSAKTVCEKVRKKANEIAQWVHHNGRLSDMHEVRRKDEDEA
jgi:hypothetical protein